MGSDTPEETPLIALDRYCTKLRAVPAFDPGLWVESLMSWTLTTWCQILWRRRGATIPVNPSPYTTTAAITVLAIGLRGHKQREIRGRPRCSTNSRVDAEGHSHRYAQGVEATFVGHDDVFVSPVLCERSGQEIEEIAK
jgi:hypothetical protein